MILLLVFGAKRLPEMGHSLGSGLRRLQGHALTSDSSAEQLQPPRAVVPVVAGVEQPMSEGVEQPVIVSVERERAA